MILTASLVKTSLFLVPTLTVLMPYDGWYVTQTSSAECSPINAKLWNPMTATWIIEGGYKLGDITYKLGHKSYHSVETLKHLDSFDYVGVEYQHEFR
jgi:hypothetical protein